MRRVLHASGRRFLLQHELREHLVVLQRHLIVLQGIDDACNIREPLLPRCPFEGELLVPEAFTEFSAALRLNYL